MDTSSAATNSLTPGFPVIDPAPLARVAADAVRTPPLPEVFRTIRIPEGRNGWRRLLAFLGPGYLVSVGYMDPGNWATDIAGGSKFGYTLLSVVLISNLMAILLQSLCVRLGVATGRDLAQACRDYFGRPIGIALWVLCEIAIVACDLAELLGSALALNLLFGIPMAIGVCLTTLDVLVLLWLQNKGFRYTEAIIVTLVATIAVCFALQVVMSQPAWGALAIGLVPTPQILANPEMLYIAMGILGATVMPHNLYLHSAIVQTRAWGASETEKRQAIKFGTIDSTAALSIAFFINAAIMVVAAAVFNRAGRFDVADIRDAYQLMSPLLGVAGASTLFAVALLASGQASTLTATLAGQIVMEGFLHIRLAAWLRRLITRLLALIPALITIVWFGEESTGSLLVLSQVVLSLQLSFAVIPLVMFTSNAKLMGAFVAPRWLISLSWVVAIAIAALNAWLLVQTLL